MSKFIFDPEVMAAPCKWPCTDWRHVHDEDLPANFVAYADMDPLNVNIIPRSSSELEVE